MRARVRVYIIHTLVTQFARTCVCVFVFVSACDYFPTPERKRTCVRCPSQTELDPTVCRVESAVVVVFDTKMYARHGVHYFHEALSVINPAVSALEAGVSEKV